MGCGVGTGSDPPVPLIKGVLKAGDELLRTPTLPSLRK